MTRVNDVLPVWLALIKIDHGARLPLKKNTGKIPFIKPEISESLPPKSRYQSKNPKVNNSAKITLKYQSNESKRKHVLQIKQPRYHNCLITLLYSGYSNYSELLIVLFWLSLLSSQNDLRSRYFVANSRSNISRL